MQVTGNTRLFPIIGNPVDKVVSPPAINAWFADHQIDAAMVPLQIPGGVLANFWALLRASDSFLGCSVTYPYKQPAFEEVDRRTARAERLGALNTIRRNQDGTLEGDATDGLALCAALGAAGFDPAGRTAHIIGAGGGAGLAITDAFCEAGIKRIILEELDCARRQKVLDLVSENWPEVEVAEGGQPAEILVNATTLGSSADDPNPFSGDLIRQAKCVCDVIGAANTLLIQDAKSAGKIAINGRSMGAGQAESQIGFILASEST